MSMITCPECNREISDKAKICPGCGMPLSHMRTSAKPESKGKPNYLSIAAIGISCVALFMSFGTTTDAAELEYTESCETVESAENIVNTSKQTLLDVNEKLNNEKKSDDEKREKKNEDIDKEDKEDKEGGADEEDKEEIVYKWKGDEKYDFTVDTVEGNTFTLSDNAGKVVLVNFWATWCGYCVDEFDDIQKLYEKYEDNPNVEIIAVNCGETTNTVHRFAKTNDYTFEIGYDVDDKVSQSYGTEYLPYTVIFDKEGSVVKVFDGQADFDSFDSVISDIL